MSDKFHVNPNGEAKPCHASKRPCKYGGPDGTSNHYATKEEAEAAYAKTQESLPKTVSKAPSLKIDVETVSERLQSSTLEQNSDNSYSIVRPYDDYVGMQETTHITVSDGKALIVTSITDSSGAVWETEPENEEVNNSSALESLIYRQSEEFDPYLMDMNLEDYEPEEVFRDMGLHPQGETESNPINSKPTKLYNDSAWVKGTDLDTSKVLEDSAITTTTNEYGDLTVTLDGFNEDPYKLETVFSGKRNRFFVDNYLVDRKSGEKKRVAGYVATVENNHEAQSIFEEYTDPEYLDETLSSYDGKKFSSIKVEEENEEI